MKHPLKKLASAVLATALLASCMSVGFLASAAGSYVFTDKFGDNKFPKAVSVFVQGGGATDKCYGFTTNAPMVESMPDDREQVMMKCMTEVESSITYEFKEGFTSFEYIGYGGGGWAGIYGKSGLFKIQWSDTLGGTYRDFKQLVVGPNKGKSTDLAGSTVDDLAKALTIAAGYEIKLFDNASNPITSSSAELTKDTLVRLYKDGKVALTYTISPEGESSSGFPLWAIFAIIGGVIIVAGVVLLIVFRDKIFKKRV